MFQLAEGLARRGHRVAIVSRPDGEVPARARAVGIDFVGLPLAQAFDLGSARRLAALYDGRQVDVVHVHKGIAHAVALAATFFAKRRPALVVNRGVSFPLDAWNRWKYRLRTDAVVTVCEDIRRTVIRSAGVAPEKVHVVYAGVDLSVFDPGRADGGRVRREWGIGDGERLLVQVGAREWKGWRDLLAGAARVVPEFADLRIAVVACRDDAQRADVAEYARGLGIADRVLPIGFRTDMPDVLSAADVVADLSYEGLGITGTLREAMALRRPVVASAAGGNPELVEDGISGVLVPPRDPGAFASALRRVLADPALAERLGAAGRARVERGFSVDARLDRIEALYRRLSAGRATAAATAGARGSGR